MDIHFMVIGNEDTFNLSVMYFDSVLEIKNKIQAAVGIPVPRQSLIMLGSELGDQYAACYYSINPEVPIYVGIRPHSERCVLRLKFTSRWFYYEVSVAHYVSDLKQAVQERERIPADRLVLSITGEELKDYKFIGEFNLTDLSEVVISMKPITRISGPQMLRFFIQTSSLHGSVSIPVEMSETNLANNLKNELSGHLPPHDNYFFVHNQDIMQPDRSLGWHGVKNGDIVYVFNGIVTTAD